MNSRVVCSDNARQLKYVVALITTQLQQESKTVPYIGLEHIESHTGRLTKNPADIMCHSLAGVDEVRIGTTFRRGDVLFGKLRPYLGKAWVAEFDGICTTEALVLRPHAIEPGFLRNILLSSNILASINAATLGSRMPRAEWEYIGNVHVPVPAREQQILITEYLDHETRRLDALIATKKRLLRLLTEKRRALITRATTHGMDSDVTLRSSGSPWLSKIPTHWEITRLKYLTNDPLTYGANEAALDDDRRFPRFVRITDIDENGTLRDDTFRSLEPAIARPYVLEEGDILFARSGATVGKAFLYDASWGRSCFAGYLVRLRCNQRSVNPHFIYAYAQSDPYWSQVRAGTIQATIQNFSAEKYGNIAIALPPLQEQLKIMEQLSRSLSSLDELRRHAESTVAFLDERRSALVNAVLGGQIQIGSAA